MVQTVCSKLALEKYNSGKNQVTPKTVGIITFYQKQRSAICGELQKIGINAKEDLSRWNRIGNHNENFDKSKPTVSVKTVDGFQVRIFS